MKTVDEITKEILTVESRIEFYNNEIRDHVGMMTNNANPYVTDSIEHFKKIRDAYRERLNALRWVLK